MPEVKLNIPYSCPVARKFSFQYEQGQEGFFLCKSQIQPRSFIREVSSITDEAVVKCSFKSALMLQPKQVSAVSQNVRSGAVALSYFAHFLDSVAFRPLRPRAFYCHFCGL